MAQEKGKKTIYDIAKAADVSPTTVSRALNHPELVSQETLSSIQDAIKTLNFSSSRGSKKQSSPVVLFLSSEMPNSFSTDLLSGMIRSVKQRDVFLLTSHFKVNADNISSFISMLKSSHVVGVITADCMSLELLKKISQVCPVVQAGERNAASELPYVGIDDHEATRKAMSHLLSIGRRRIALINGPLEYSYARTRLESYRTFIQDNGLDIPENWIVSLPQIDYALAYSTAVQLLSYKERPDAIFCSSDVLAVAVNYAARELNVKVPEDLAVIGFDNSLFSAISSPPITTISQPTYQIGFSAAQMLFDLLNDPLSNPGSLTFPTELIVRGSTLANM